MWTAQTTWGTAQTNRGNEQNAVSGRFNEGSRSQKRQPTFGGLKNIWTESLVERKQAELQEKQDMIRLAKEFEFGGS